MSQSEIRNYDGLARDGKYFGFWKLRTNRQIITAAVYTFIILIFSFSANASSTKCENLFSSSNTSEIKRAAESLAQFRTEIISLKEPAKKNVLAQEFEQKIQDFLNRASDRDQALSVFSAELKKIKIREDLESHFHRRQQIQNDASEVKAMWSQYVEIPQALISKAEFSSDGSLLLAKNYAGLISLYDTKTWREVGLSLPVNQNKNKITSARFLKDGKTIIYAVDNQIKIYDRIKREQFDLLPTHFLKTDPIRDFSVSEDGSKIACIYSSGEAIFYDLHLKQSVDIPIKFHVQPFNFIYTEIVYSESTGKVIASVAHHSVVFDLKTKEATTFLYTRNPHPHISMSSDQIWTMSWSPEYELTLINLQTMEKVVLKNRPSNVLNAFFTPDGSRVVMIGTKQSSVLDLKTKKETFFSTPEYMFTPEVSVNSSGILVLSSTRDAPAVAFDLNTGSPIKLPFESLTDIRASTAAPDESKFVIDSNGSLLIWFQSAHEAEAVRNVLNSKP